MDSRYTVCDKNKGEVKGFLVMGESCGGKHAAMQYVQAK